MATTDAPKEIACVWNPSSIVSIIHPCDGLSSVCLLARDAKPFSARFWKNITSISMICNYKYIGYPRVI
jgi:hypothetical protein